MARPNDREERPPRFQLHREFLLDVQPLTFDAGGGEITAVGIPRDVSFNENSRQRRRGQRQVFTARAATRRL